MPVMGGGIVADPRRQRHGILSSGSGPAFSPSDLASLAHWYRSDIGVLKSGGAAAGDGEEVVTWQDQVGSAHFAKVGTGPTAKTAILNGLPSLLFNGATTANPIDAAIVLAQPFTIIIIGKMAGNNGGGISDTDYFYDDDNESGRVTLTVNWSGSGDGNKFSLNAGAEIHTADQPTWKNVWATWTAKFNNASSSLRRNATSVLSGTVGTNNLHVLRVGSRAGGTNGLQGYVSEILVGTFSDAERDQIEAYAQSRYAHY